MIFAEVTTSVTTTELGTWTACALLFANLYAQLRKQKREVTIESDGVSKPDFEHFKTENRDEHNAIHSKVGGVERGAHKRMDELTQDYNNKFQQMAREYNDKLQALPHQIIALMKNGGMLK